ncbi:MAG: glycosyltransferase family 2 protein [Ruminococcaceae bacterium]|nr:glycosyltransferase family 2 protein [Oscillospiraceae bacterium]
MKLSIVICVCNTSRPYFRECLEAIRGSTLSFSDYEILVVDDGSEVDYSDFVDQYKLRYVKTENRGILAARMYALKLAEGDYIHFYDSDDCSSFNYHAPMLLKAEREGADIVINDWAFLSERAKYVCTRDTTIKGDLSYSGDDVLKAFASQCGREHAYFVLWNKIFKREVLLKAIKEIEALDLTMCPVHYSEDALINFFAFKNARRLVNIHTGYYFYRIHPRQSVNVSSKDKLISQVTSMTDTLGAMMNNIGDNVHKEYIYDCIQRWNELMARSHYSYAKAKKYLDVIPYIKERYGVEKLRGSTFKDGSAYTKNRILAENFAEIDSALMRLFKMSDTPTDVCYDKTDDYIRSSVEHMCEHQGKIIAWSRDAKNVIPEAKISFKTKFLHNHIVYSAGMILFKKGSKIRAFLKKRF